MKEQNRGITTQGTLALINDIRSAMPRASIRTTFIVGLPGETEKDFDELTSFIQDFHFEKVGVFIYSKEEGTAAYTMEHHVPDATKKKRMNALMQLQQEISREVQQSHIGKVMKVLIDEQQENEKNIYLGRSEYDAPDVDGVVFVHSTSPLKGGDFVQVRITDAYEYDLAGEVV